MTPNFTANNLQQPLKQSSLIDQTRLQIKPNLANEMLDFASLQKIYRWMLDRYINPQMNGRRSYERIWDVLYDAYRLRLKLQDLKLHSDDKFLTTMKEKAEATGVSEIQITDTLIFDTVDRMANLTHFIAWKDGVPVQFNPPRYMDTPLEDRFYAPTRDKYRAANCILDFCIQGEGVYRKHRLGSKDHFLYGISFISSELKYRLQIKNEGRPDAEVLLQDIGVSYNPLSIRKVWVDYLLPLADMNMQPCPFWYENAAEFAILQNTYDPVTNPFGFSNLDKLQRRLYDTFAGSQQNWMKALRSRLESMGQSLYQSEETNVSALWTFFPMLPLDPDTGDFETYPDGRDVPYKRFVWQHYGQDPITARIVPLRLQDASFYTDLPIFGTTHLEDLDSGAYGMSICEALLNYTIELSRCREQYILNKDQINNPTTWHVAGSPSYEQDVNKPGAKINVIGPNDFGWRTVPDATQTTVGMLSHLRERAQTTSKVVEAILGKAMGGRTSATEAQNVFQAAMSGVTTDINFFNFDTMGNYAKRVFEYTTRWFDIDLIKKITGNYGMVLALEDMNIGLSLKFDVGSSFIESIVKQGHIRYFLEAGARSPILDQRILFKALAEELKIRELSAAIIPDGVDREVQKATEQAISTFLGKRVIIDPNQNHQIALEVKMRFLEDVDSVWMSEYGQQPYELAAPLQITRASFLSQQIAIHQQWIQIQMMQQMQEQIASLQMMESGAKHGDAQQAAGGGGLPSLTGPGPTTQGAALSQAQQ